MANPKVLGSPEFYFAAMIGGYHSKNTVSEVQRFGPYFNSGSRHSSLSSQETRCLSIDEKKNLILLF